MQLPQFAAHADMEERHWWFLGRRQILVTLLHELLPPSKSTHLIDVGCGTGGLTKYFSHEYSIVGIDPAKEAIDFAKKKFPECTFIHGHAPNDVQEQVHNANGVLLVEVLEHVEDDMRFVHELIAAMKPGAYLFIMAPADMSLWSPHDTAFEHYRRYDSLEEFRALWSGTPVSELLVSYCNTRLRPVVKLMRKLSAMRGKAWGKGGTDIDVPPQPVNTLLKKIFGGEARSLVNILRGKGNTKRRKGVSVIAVLRKC